VWSPLTSIYYVTVWLPIFFKITYFVSNQINKFYKVNKVVWNILRVCK